MNDKFDELAKCMAQAVTRRGALRKFGFGLAGLALATFGLANKAEAGHHCQCKKPDFGCGRQFNPGTAEYYACQDFCGTVICPGGFTERSWREQIPPHGSWQ
jgi:hypothetical protein